MNKKGFSLIELLIVVAIIAVLAGVAIPYYNDYIIDSRTSVLQNNLATIRKAINQFRADNQRGPIRVNVKINSSDTNYVINGETKSFIVSGKDDPFDELVNGPLQNINGSWIRRQNIKYLSSKPMLIDPATGVELDYSQLELATGSCWYGGDVNEFIINDNFAYIDAIGTTTYYTYFVNPFNYKGISDAPGGVASNSMDYVDVKLIQQ